MFSVFVWVFCVCRLLYFLGGRVGVFCFGWVFLGDLYFNLYKERRYVSLLLLFSILCPRSFTVLSFCHNISIIMLCYLNIIFIFYFDCTVTSTIYTQSTSSEK